MAQIGPERAQRSGNGGGQDDYWLNIGLAFPPKDGKGLQTSCCKHFCRMNGWRTEDPDQSIVPKGYDGIWHACLPMSQ